MVMLYKYSKETGDCKVFFGPGQIRDRILLWKLRSFLCPRGQMFAFTYHLTLMVGCPVGLNHLTGDSGIIHGNPRSPNILVVARNRSYLLLEKGKMNYSDFRNQNKEIIYLQS